MFQGAERHKNFNNTRVDILGREKLLIQNIDVLPHCIQILKIYDQLIPIFCVYRQENMLEAAQNEFKLEQKFFASLLNGVLQVDQQLCQTDCEVLKQLGYG